MVQFRVRGLPPIRLQDLLKKRRTNLKAFVKNTGIATYATLQQKCNKLGVSSPTEDEFNEALGETISSPQEGIIVLDPPDLLKDTGEKIKVDSSPVVEEDVVEVSSSKKKSQKREPLRNLTDLVDEKQQPS